MIKMNILFITVSFIVTKFYKSHLPFFQVEFRFVATFLLYDIDLSMFIFDPLQSVKG